MCFSINVNAVQNREKLTKGKYGYVVYKKLKYWYQGDSISFESPYKHTRYNCGYTLTNRIEIAYNFYGNNFNIYAGLHSYLKYYKPRKGYIYVKMYVPEDSLVMYNDSEVVSIRLYWNKADYNRVVKRLMRKK